jgi:hypothetical protein
MTMHHSGAVGEAIIPNQKMPGKISRMERYRKKFRSFIDASLSTPRLGAVIEVELSGCPSLFSQQRRKWDTTIFAEPVAFVSIPGRRMSAATLIHLGTI